MIKQFISILTISLILLMGTYSIAEGPGSGHWGAGLEIGGTTAVTGQYWLERERAVDFGLGLDGSWNMLYGIYQWHFPGIFGRSSRFAQQTQGYLGAGGGLSFWSGGCGRWSCGNDHKDGTGFFARGQIGAMWSPGSPTLGVFAELDPTIAITPVSSSGFDIELGVRYYFR